MVVKQILTQKALLVKGKIKVYTLKFNKNTIMLNPGQKK